MHLHVLGICGTFMGGLAALAREAGHRVTGCDANVYPPMSDQLAALGIELIEGYDAAQLKLAPDLFVVGNAITRGNPLLEAVLDAGAPTPAARSGSPTTCSPAATCSPSPAPTARPAPPRCSPGSSSRPGKRPGFLVGGVPLDFGVSARRGDPRRRS
jgi:UDP-N-acetylmuramate: L-alanyl-gamma-D-glutamyl-meso-diaminopimelate ligase